MYTRDFNSAENFGKDRLSFALTFHVEQLNETNNKERGEEEVHRKANLVEMLANLFPGLSRPKKGEITLTPGRSDDACERQRGERSFHGIYRSHRFPIAIDPEI